MVKLGKHPLDQSLATVCHVTRHSSKYVETLLSKMRYENRPTIPTDQGTKFNGVMKNHYSAMNAFISYFEFSFSSPFTLQLMGTSSHSCLIEPKRKKF